MLELSQDPQVARRELRGIIFCLTTFGYIDGEFDARERQYVRDAIRKIVAARVDAGLPDAEDGVRDALTLRFTAEFNESFDQIDAMVAELFTEAVASGEKHDVFVRSKLKLRCFEFLSTFDADRQANLLGIVNELLMADGRADPAEIEFRDELARVLGDTGPPAIPGVVSATPMNVVVSPLSKLDHTPVSHPLFDRLEHHYSADPDRIARQIGADLGLIERVNSAFAQQRAAGDGRLSGHHRIDEFRGGEPFLDEHVYVVPLRSGPGFDVTVLGDLHGCYSCLKAAVLQSRFFEKVQKWRANPSKHADPKLVMLGDYIDRGIYSYNGVLRAALQLFATLPDHVYILRGNHEYYIEHEGEVYGGVRPSEAINSLRPHVHGEVFLTYRHLFESMPNILLLDGFLFAHGGIPRDTLVHKVWRDLESLNHAEIRFQMMWSDPSEVDFVPAAMQQETARFPFGRMQCRAFLERIGCHTIVRGHEKIREGARLVYDGEVGRLMTLFSSGGSDNDDLPPKSGYRSVRPAALSIRVREGEAKMTPWLIDYRPYNDPSRNAFYKAPPEIEHLIC